MSDGIRAVGDVGNVAAGIRSNGITACSVIVCRQQIAPAFVTIGPDPGLQGFAQLVFQGIGIFGAGGNVAVFVGIEVGVTGPVIVFPDKLIQSVVLIGGLIPRWAAGNESCRPTSYVGSTHRTVPGFRFNFPIPWQFSIQITL